MNDQNIKMQLAELVRTLLEDADKSPEESEAIWNWLETVAAVPFAYGLTVPYAGWKTKAQEETASDAAERWCVERARRSPRAPVVPPEAS